MKRTLYERLLTGGFCLALSGMMLVNFAKADNSFSPTENRDLAQSPELSSEAVWDGSYMSDFETYLNDQFIFRDQWVALKAVMERLIGKTENNSVYFAEGGTLIKEVVAPGEELMLKNAGYLNTLAEKIEVPLSVGMIPSAAEVWKDRLPSYAPTADETSIIHNFYDALTDNINKIPLLEQLQYHKDEDIYYRTDHHWTSLGAYYGYESVVHSMGLAPASLQSYSPTLVSDSFFGTIYSSSGVRWVQPDSIYTYVQESEDIKVTSNFTGIPVEGALYVPSYLNEKDKYSFFLGGVQPLCIIETENTDAPSILVVRDSYSDSLAPFLTENFSEIHLLDLRFYHASVSGYVQSNNIDQVLVLYSLGNFVSDNNLFKLGM